MSDEMFSKSKSFAKPIHKIKYDLINDRVEGEEISKIQKENICLMLSFWEENLFDNISKSSPPDGNALSYFMQDDLFEQIAEKILNKIDCLNVTEDRKFDLDSLVYEIGTKIFAFSSFLIQFNVFMKIKMLKYYIISVVNVIAQSQGRLNYKKVALLLLEKADLKIKDKYLIACYLCLEYKVKELVDILPEKFVRKFIEFDKNEINQLMALWYFHFKNQEANYNTAMNKLKLQLNETNNNNCLMIWAMQRGNGDAVQYIWNKVFEGSEKKYPQKFADLALYEYDISGNMVCYFISKIICDDQIERLYVNEGYALISTLANESRWHEYLLPTSEYILLYINKMDFICTLRTLIWCWIINKPKRYLYVHYFNDFNRKFNVKMSQNILYSKTSIFNVILELEKRENINFLLGVESDNDFKNIFKDDLIIIVGFELLVAHKIEIFEQFIEDVLTGDDLRKFKNDFFNCTIKEIRSQWDKSDYDSIEEFKNKFCCN